MDSNESASSDSIAFSNRAAGRGADAQAGSSGVRSTHRRRVVLELSAPDVYAEGVSASSPRVVRRGGLPWVKVTNTNNPNGVAAPAGTTPLGLLGFVIYSNGAAQANAPPWVWHPTRC